MDKYEIHIGEYYDLEEKVNKPKQKLIITGEQLEAIETFASKRKDSELNTIYKINDCEFRVYPHFDFKAIWEESAPKPKPVKEWEIVALDESFHLNDTNTPDLYFKAAVERGAIIKSVRRVSDGKVFTVGDEVTVSFDSGKGFKNTIHHFTYTSGVDIIDVYFTQQTAAYNIAKLNIEKAKQHLFTTFDNKPIYEGDEYWIVFPDFTFDKWDAFKNGNAVFDKDEKTFSTEQAAKEYILMNKPCLSVSQVLKLEVEGVATLETGAERPIAINKSDLIALAKAEQ